MAEGSGAGRALPDNLGERRDASARVPASQRGGAAQPCREAGLCAWASGGWGATERAPPARETASRMKRAGPSIVWLGDPWKVPGGARRADDRSERGSRAASPTAPGAWTHGGVEVRGGRGGERCEVGGQWEACGWCGECGCGATQRAEVGAGRSRRGPAGAATRGGLLDLIAGTAHDRGKEARSWWAVCAAGWSSGAVCGGVVCPIGVGSIGCARSWPAESWRGLAVKPWAVCAGVFWSEGLAARAAGRSRARWAVGRGAEGWPVARWGGQVARSGRRVGGGRASGVEQPFPGRRFFRIGRGRADVRRCSS